MDGTSLHHQRRRSDPCIAAARAAHRVTRNCLALGQPTAGRHVHLAGHDADRPCAPRSWNRGQRLVLPRHRGSSAFGNKPARLVSGEKFYEGIETAKMFWWFNQSAPVRYSATPKPHYGCDGSKVFDILDHTECNLTRRLGPFPFFSFWGPSAGLAQQRLDRRGDRPS